MSAVIKTLKRKTDDGLEQKVYPKTLPEAVIDAETGKTLDVVLSEIDTKIDNIEMGQVPEGTTYIHLDETDVPVPTIEPVTSAKLVSFVDNDGAIGASDVQHAIEAVASVAKGRNRARVFNTTHDMHDWLGDEANKGQAIVGDNLYIVDVGVPDWWIAEVLDERNPEGFYYNIAQLETQKVDLTTVQNSLDDAHRLIEEVRETKVSIDSIVDDLTSEATDAPLSANQGRILKTDVNFLGAKWLTQSTSVKGTVTFTLPYGTGLLFCQWGGADLYAIYYINMSNNLVAPISKNSDAWTVTISDNNTKLNISNQDGPNQWADYRLLRMD